MAAFAEEEVLSLLNDEEIGPKIKCVEKGCPHKLSIALLAEGIDSPRSGSVHSAEITSLIGLSESAILNHGKGILDTTEKLLKVTDEGDFTMLSEGRKKAPQGVPGAVQVRGIDLKQLHSLLISLTAQPSLETANLGLIRRYDKGQNRHLWVHESQQGDYEKPRALK